MASAQRTHQDQVAAAYEQHLRDHWHTLSPFEQEQARAYMQAKFQSTMAPTDTNEVPGWTVPTAYVCAFVALLLLPVIFGPVSFGLGVYNTAKGKVGHGVAQIILSIVCTLLGLILGVLAWSA